MNKPPHWNDERAAEKLAESEILSAVIEVGGRREAEPEIMVVRGLKQAISRRRNLRAAKEFDLAGAESAALDAAERGDIVPLIKLITWLPPEDMAKLSPEALRLIADLLLVNLPKASKLPLDRGRPKMTEAERRKASPVHDAADEVPLIIPILARMYPERSRAEVRRRAVEVAAIRHGVNFETLLLYVNRPRKDRRRIHSRIRIFTDP
jgi:hypothetical protein